MSTTAQRGTEKVLKTMNVKVTLHYGADMQTEIWVAGPHAGIGVALDALMGLHDTNHDLTSITIVPNPNDVPRFGADG